MSSYGALYAPPPAPTSPETLALTYGNLSLIPSIAPYLGGEPYEDDKSLSTLPLNQLMNEIGTLASKMFVHRRTFKRIHACCQWLLKTLVSLDGHEQRWDSWVRRVDLLIRNVHHKAREWVDLGVVGSLAMQDNILSEMNGLMGQAEELGIAKHSSVMDELTRRASNDEPKDKKDLDDLLERVLTRHEYRDKAMKLEGEQANLFLNQLVKVVDSRPASDRIRETALAAAYELSITTKSLPSDFEVPSIDDRSSKPILSGRFADIWGADRQGRALALKIPRSEVPEEEHDVLRRFYHEVFLTRYLKHSHIVEFIGITRQYAPQVGIVSPWMVNGMVLDFVADRPMVNRTALVAQIASALGYLHNRENPILHQNIRCENIVINDKGQALLTGFSVSHIRSEMSNTTVTNTRSGFVRWLAPELTTPDTEERPSRASDIWQFSMCILELLTGSHPFMESILHETVTMDLLQGKTPTRPSTWTYRKRGLTEPLWNLLEQCWALDMDSRPSITDMSYTLDHLASQWKFHPHPPPDSPDVNPRSSSPSRFVNRPTSPVPMPDFGVYPPRAATPTSRQYGMSPQRMPLPLSPMASQRPLSPRPSGSRPHSPAIALNEVIGGRRSPAQDMPPWRSPRNNPLGLQSPASSRWQRITEEIRLEEEHAQSIAGPADGGKASLEEEYGVTIETFFANSSVEPNRPCLWKISGPERHVNNVIHEIRERVGRMATTMTDHINLPSIRGVEFLAPSRSAAERLKAHYSIQIEFTETFSIGSEGEMDISVKIVGPRADVIPAAAEFRKLIEYQSRFENTIETDQPRGLHTHLLRRGTGWLNALGNNFNVNFELHETMKMTIRGPSGGLLEAKRGLFSQFGQIPATTEEVGAPIFERWHRFLRKNQKFVLRAIRQETLRLGITIEAQAGTDIPFVPTRPMPLDSDVWDPNGTLWQIRRNVEEPGEGVCVWRLTGPVESDLRAIDQLINASVAAASHLGFLTVPENNRTRLASLEEETIESLCSETGTDIHVPQTDDLWHCTAVILGPREALNMAKLRILNICNRPGAVERTFL